MRNRLYVCVIVLVLGSARGAWAQEKTKDFTDWMHQRLQIAAAPVLGASTPGKQVETPSIAENSTALVDTAGAPDLIGIALQFLNVGKDREGAPASVTLSAFTLRTAFLGLNPTRPEVYSDGRHWRRVSVSVGREAADATAGATEAHLIGVKVLAWDRRDPTHPDNVRDLQDALRQSTTTKELSLAIDAVMTEIARRLAPQFGIVDLQTFMEERLGDKQHAETLAKLTDADLVAVDALLLERIAPVILAQRRDALRSIEALKSAPQLAFSYQAKLRDGDGADEHQWQGIFDYGVATRLNLSVNAALSRTSTPLDESSFGGRIAVEAQFQLTGGGSSATGLLRRGDPLTLSAAYSGSWNDVEEDTHKLQTKLTIPLPSVLKGLSLPVSLTVASRRELIDESDVRGQVGFTIDFSKLQQALRSAAR